MISIIISSVNEVLLKNIKINVAETIGVEHEIIAIDNSKGEKGICEIYNLGAKLAKYDVLCFMHEDIKIHTLNWGEVVRHTFHDNKKLGLIGIAGSQYKSLTPSGWHCYGIDAEIQYFNIIQNYKFSKKEKSTEYSNPTAVKLAKVVCIDGVWFCCTREAVLSYPFDENLLKGFHGYDLDFALGINQNYEVGVTFEVLIEHFSEGNFNKAWLSEILKVHAKWREKLPINLAQLPQNKILLEEKRAFRSILKRMWNEGFSIAAMHSLLWDSRRSKLMTVGLFVKIYSQLIKYVFKSRQSF
ncbi:hypothetical protein GM921_13135 [Pedobacter sp. LMG 31464]|uniref:Streptomycin biosynthesis protein StrF domain-containing protein n=1 Tax=Pedobacter planticolens TaxID=2679964 RepID=A0A923E2P8_9SPHI|nr:glycosyltransferase [Pedobacter planticolens]MBB2146439.1 hypothetical protein [Pedobacter planticolens]